MVDSETLAEIEAVGPWYFKIEVAPGVFTPGASDPHWTSQYADIYLSNVAGKSVLDVGAWDGLYSFEAKARGARRVLACDYHCWGHGGPGKYEAFALARRLLKADVEDKTIDIPDISESSVGRFDLVMYNGIFYHVFNPLWHLEKLASICDETLTLETEMGLNKLGEPAMVYFGGDMATGSPGRIASHGWGPNLLLLWDVFTHLGFTAIEYRPSPANPTNRCIIKAHRRADLADAAHVLTRELIPAIASGLV